MATQIDPLSSRPFKETRSWRRRDASSTLTRQARSGPVDGDSESSEPSPTPTQPLSSLSLSPSPPTSRSGSGRRSRPRTVVSTPALSVSPSTLSIGVAYTLAGVARSITSQTPTRKLAVSDSKSDQTEISSDEAVDHLSRPDSSLRDSHPDCLEVASSSPVSDKDKGNDNGKTSQSTQQPSCSRNINSTLNPDQNNGASLSLKRRRALSDVDGPSTGVLCCKKRRLRRFLITSRLSQPFSQPASHILNRESVASGDKRFLKLASIMNARRIRSSTSAATTTVAPPPEAVWRAAMANRFRKRIIADTATGRSIAGAPVQLMNSARLVLVPVSLASSMAAVRINSSVHGAYMPGHKAPSATATEDQVPAGIGRDSAIGIMPRRARSHSTSPRLRPVRDTDSRYKSAEQDYPRPSLADDDGDCAFPTSEHGSRYEVDDYDDEDDRPDDEVYADFSVLFGSSGDDTDWGGGNEEGLDDYMDELDGIAHLPR